MRASKNTLLWSFMRPGSARSFVYGTMHVQDEEAFYAVNKLIPHLRTCNYFAAELDLGARSVSTGSIDKVQPESRISEMLTKSQFESLDRCCRLYLGHPARAFDNMYPLMLVQLFTARILQQNRPVSLDHTLWEKAEKLDLQCVGLETYQEQLSDFHQIPIFQQRRSLIQVIQNFAGYRRHLLKMLEYYRSGDIRALYTSTKKSLGRSRKHLLYQRNERLTVRMVSIKRDNNVFAAIGAAHLWGKFGVLRQLKLHGFLVRPVDLNTLPDGNK